MDNRAGIGRDGKETNIAYKGQEDMESHDLLHPKKTQYIKEEEFT